ncbi:uncharacterized protein BDR25DRAFT_300710 [Lindgomyces ingoldianus]|uniref:Uncharacterized protein n=1 Tax=Lindgomyces ingoldianus TaxID=673940 RepID=A0ACB6RBJ8_9PLEO|nr:uncharacterized protein BDR25DRAFT_300710 [Lindgomyces ingoldianus]KAF2475702.1 hypothetical protein BDR25DRAFT_300710 [Lindgomyces ingoldianus]
MAVAAAVGSDKPVGRLVVELWVDEAPRACAMFTELLSTGDAGMRIVEEFFTYVDPGVMIRGQHVSEQERIVGVMVCGMEAGGGCNVSKGMVGILCNEEHPNISQHFIALGPLPHRPGTTHTVFGRVISDTSMLDQLALAAVDTSNSSHLLSPIFITSYGLLDIAPSTTTATPLDIFEERGRHKRRRKSSHTPTRMRSPSPSRGHYRDSGSRHRRLHDHYRKHHRQSSSSSISISPPLSSRKIRRRSDAELDHTLRGRARKRSRTRSPIVENEEEALEPRSHRKRSPPPSRHRPAGGRAEGSGVRRQRSLPNIYREERSNGGGFVDGDMEGVKGGPVGYKGKENEGMGRRAR